MGFFDWFKPYSREEAINDYFFKEEKNAQKWPSKHYQMALGVYLSGSILYEDEVDGKRKDVVEQLPQYKDWKKAADLCHEAMKKSNISAMRAKFGANCLDPSGELAQYLAVITEDEAEKDRWCEYCLKNLKHKPAYDVANYIYNKGLVERYCHTTVEKMALYQLMTETNLVYAANGGVSDYGREHFIWQEMLGGRSKEECQQLGCQEMKKLMQSDDPQISKDAIDFVAEQIRKNEARLDQCSREYYEICLYMQDHLGVKFVDEDNHPIELVDGKVRRIH